MRRLRCLTRCGSTGKPICLIMVPELCLEQRICLGAIQEYCGKDSKWLCAEFVARALHHAGMFPGVKDFGSYKGYNLRLVSSLHKALQHYGWKAHGHGCCGPKGAVIIYNGNQHAALSIGESQTFSGEPGHSDRERACGNPLPALFYEILLDPRGGDERYSQGVARLISTTLLAVAPPATGDPG
jgi:hypothetical protein